MKFPSFNHERKEEHAEQKLRSNLEARLEKKLFDWPGKTGKEPVNIARMLQGTQIFGGTGSGKSSGSGAAIAQAFLKSGFGGLVLCAKPDEKKTWMKYAEITGTSKDRFVIFGVESGLQFNPIRYENERKGEGGGDTLNLVDLIMNIHLLGQNYMSGGGGGGNEMFWDNALRRCLSRSIDLLKGAGEPLSIENMRKIVSSAPKSENIMEYRRLLGELLKGREEDAKRQLEQFMLESYCMGCLSKSLQNLDGIENKDEEEARYSYNLVENYFMREFAFLSDRTRSSIEEYFFGLVEPFSSGILRRFFVGERVDPQLMPENTYMDGKIIILDFSVKDHLLAGIYAQGLYKYIWQQCMERRRPLEDGYQNPVFLWADESQYFINPNYDTLFQTTARSSLVCTVYLTQSINNYYFAMGSRSPEARAKALLANMGTKIFHANSDFETNHWASQMIGVKKGFMGSRENRLEPGVEERLSEQLLLQVQPNRFARLAFGREENDRKVEAVIVTTGGRWTTTDNDYLEAEFSQG